MTIYPPSAYRNEIPSDLDEIVMRSLERNPEKRYYSASDMALALTKFLLKCYPDFKPGQINDFLAETFQDDDNTGDLFQEKTAREELTMVDAEEISSSSEEGKTHAEETIIIDPQELDFHSVFDEIDVEELSDITRAINVSETSSTGSVMPIYFSEDDLNVEERVGQLRKSPNPLHEIKQKKLWILGLLIATILLGFVIYKYFFST
jgi:serine/threonine protein kinase